MCNSVVRGKDYVEDFYRDNIDKINSVFDIGCGRGIWAGCFKSIKPEVGWYGIEIWKPYVDKYKDNLNRLYNKIYIENIIKFEYKRNYDLIIMGDILEHVEYNSSIKVLKEAINNSKYFVVSIPLGEAVHPPEHGNKYQEHINTGWTLKKLERSIFACGGDIIRSREFDCAWLNDPIKLGVAIGHGKNNMVCG